MRNRILDLCDYKVSHIGRVICDAMHMFGYEQVASNAALTAITPIPDPSVVVSGNDVRVPKGMANVVFAAALINSAAATLRAELQSPLLRSILNFDFPGISNGLVFPSTYQAARLWNTPLPLAELEGLDFYTQNGASVMNRAFVMFADGVPTPVKGRVYTVRATAAASLVTATWVNSSLTFQQTLPAGHYQIVGMRGWSANGNAMRIYPVGGMWRPGCIMGTAESSIDWPDFHWGNIGVLAEFDNTVPPTADFMGITDTAQVLTLDLIKTS